MTAAAIPVFTGMTDTNKTDTGCQFHKTDEVCPVFTGMTDLEKQLTKQPSAVVMRTDKTDTVHVP
jgi:hypothetical protein